MLNTVSKIRGQVKNPGYPQSEGLLGECMIRHGKELGGESNFGEGCGGPARWAAGLGWLPLDGGMPLPQSLLQCVVIPWTRVTEAPKDTQPSSVGMESWGVAYRAKTPWKACPLKPELMLGNGGRGCLIFVITSSSWLLGLRFRL